MVKIPITIEIELTGNQELATKHLINVLRMSLVGRYGENNEYVSGGYGLNSDGTVDMPKIAYDRIFHYRVLNVRGYSKYVISNINDRLLD